MSKTHALAGKVVFQINKGELCLFEEILQNMGYIQCCSGLHECKTFKLLPDENFTYKQIDYLEHCPICGHTVLQLSKIDNSNSVTIYRIKNQKARTFFEKYTKDMIEEKSDSCNIFFKNSGKFYLNYNEYGKKRKCYSNLSSMK